MKKATKKAPAATVLISQRAFGRKLGVSLAAVQRAVAAGRITLTAGKVDPAAAERQWRANTDPSKPRNILTGNPRKARPAGAPSVPMDFGLGLPAAAGGQGSGAEYARARATREIYQAHLAKLDLDRQMGLLVRADEMKVAAFNAARRARDQIISLPERLAVILAATPDPAEVHRILEEEADRICQDLSNADRR
jgi:hypothetical protein